MKNQEIAWLLNEKYHGEKSAAFFADCARLEAGEPLAYLIDSIPFLHTTITLTSHPLIPRPETEYWTERAIQDISSRLTTQPETATPLQILDLCAGSGAIGIAVATAIPTCRVTLAEIDQAHLPTITANSFANRLPAARHTIVKSDLFAQVEGTFDYILTNPPYIDPLANTVHVSVTSFEPHIALFGGIAGMEIIERIIAGARAKLAPRGQLWIEHEPFQSDAIAMHAGVHGFVATTYPDQYGTLRYSILTQAVAQ